MQHHPLGIRPARPIWHRHPAVRSADELTFAADGTLTAVDAVQVPFRDGKSVRINDRAVPQLNSEALSAQSASIDTVSGATYTSIGYQDSLQSAIDIAVANGVPAAASA